MTGYEPLTERPSGLSPHIAHLSLGKPFRRADLNPRLKALIAYIQGTISVEIVERAFPAEIKSASYREDKMDLSRFEGSDLSFLMAALPVHPQNVENVPSELTRILPLVVGGLQALRSSAQTASSEVFSTLRRALFPVNKRRTLLSILEHVSPAAALVLDCVWHDVNNACMAWENDPSEAAEHRREIETILNPAVDAFDGYLTTGDLRSFVASQPVDFSYFKPQGEGTLSVPDSPEGLSVLAPMGAMASLWRTFVTNAAKVADRHYLSEYLLGLTARIEDGMLHVFIYDNLPSFSGEQLSQLFDAQLSSDTAGMGTGLQRLADLMDLLNRDLSGSSPLTSYHRDAGGVSWKVKSPSQQPRSLSVAEVAECVEALHLPAGATKVFHLQFPIAT